MLLVTAPIQVLVSKTKRSFAWMWSTCSAFDILEATNADAAIRMLERNSDVRLITSICRVQ